MNFEEIKRKYPKAWEKFEAFASYECYDWVGGGIEDLSGWLFKFFDDQGIHIEIYIIYGGGNRQFGWAIDELNKENGLRYKIRTKAWEAAFPKAFEILED